MWGSSKDAEVAVTGAPHEGVALASIVLVVPLKKDDTKSERLLSFQNRIVAPCVRAGLAVKGFYGIKSFDGSRSIYLQVSTSNDRLLLEAERIGMRLALDKKALSDADEAENRSLMLKGMCFDPEGGDSEHLDLHIPTAAANCCSCCLGGLPHNPYEHIYGPFVPDPAKRALYKAHHSSRFILTEVQALRLLKSIMEASAKTENGAGLNLDGMVAEGRLLTRWFPAHVPESLKAVVAASAGVKLPWDVPILKYREYFSERVAFYFAFLAHFGRWLWLPALVGLAVFIHQVYIGTPNVSYLPLYGVLVALWSTLFFEYWKRVQSKLAQHWGMTGFAKIEPKRPQFIASARTGRSLVTGKPDFQVSSLRQRFVQTVSASVIATCLGAVVVVVGSIFWVRVLLTNDEAAQGGKLPNGWGNYITSIINAVQIQVMNVIYSWLATGLTNWENHPTKTSYDNSLTLKLALFQSINSYFGLVYIAAIKNNITIDGKAQSCANNSLGVPDCMAELQSQLAILMLTRWIMSVALAVLLPLAQSGLSACYTRCQVRNAPDKAAAYKAWRVAKDASPLERESDLSTYTTDDDYLEIMLQFGYTALFIVAFPLAPLISLANVVTNVYLDRSEMYACSRALPDGAQDIGAWMFVFEALSYASAVTNIAIVVFTNQSYVFGYSLSSTQRLVFFIVAEHIVLLIKYGISVYIPDATAGTRLQLQREKYLVAKHVRGVQDLIISRADAKAAISSGTAADAGVLSADGTQIRLARSYFSLAQTPDPRGSGADLKELPPNAVAAGDNDAAGASLVVRGMQQVPVASYGSTDYVERDSASDAAAVAVAVPSADRFENPYGGASGV